MSKFFIVFNPDGEAPPVRQHKTREAAFGVAHMMAARHPGKTFHVMQSASKGITKPAEAVAEEEVANVT